MLGPVLKRIPLKAFQLLRRVEQWLLCFTYQSLKEHK